MGGLMAARYLWEGAIVPSLLSGAGTWVGITVRQEEMCEDLQEMFWRTILQVPRGTPRVMLRAETGSLRMKYRIWKLKLQLVRRIKKQEGSLAKAVYDEQVTMGWGGLAKEVAEISKKLGIENENTAEMSKDELEERVVMANYKEMKDEMEKYEKLKTVKNEDFREPQEYMNLRAIDKGRMAFRIRTRMVNKVRMNFKNMFKESLKCDKCEMREDETQEHLMLCPGWMEERGDLDMYKVEDQVEFFHKMLKKK